MTNYDILIDSITNELYKLNINMDGWDENFAKKTSHRILEIVEEFQFVRNASNIDRKSS
jgi:hypothetical protein